MAKAKSATRRGERELAFQVLYGLSFTPARDIDDLRNSSNEPSALTKYF